MITPLEYGLATAAILAILVFIFCCSDTECVDDKGCGCCLAVVILLAAIIYLVYFVIRSFHVLLT